MQANLMFSLITSSCSVNPFSMKDNYTELTAFAREDYSDFPYFSQVDNIVLAFRLEIQGTNFCVYVLLGLYMKFGAC